jgi:hypothetical protein
MNKMKENTIKKIVEFCRDELCILNNVVIKVYLKDLTEDNAHGSCYNDNKTYIIELEKTLDDNELLVALCHEMVHVRQFSEGDRADEREAHVLEVQLAEKYNI